MSFDVDCGHLTPGHRFIARGLGDDGLISGPEPESASRPDDYYPGITLYYELVPGVEPAELQGVGRGFPFLVGIGYEADVPLPWTPNDHGAIAPFQGGNSTDGSRGSWPLPRQARILRFVLTGFNEATGHPRDHPDGVLVVDLADETAEWRRAG